jgi:hypothetical protein
MRKLLIGLLALGLTFPAFSQETGVEELSEVVVVATNYKYLSAVDSKESPIPVRMLEREVAQFNLKDSEYYQDDYDLYYIDFYIPEGSILAAYDRDGKVIRTIERFKDVKLPNAVAQAVAKQYPGWTISKDVYTVNYHENKGVEKKFKLRLENRGKKMWVKTDEKGTFL